MTVTTCNQPFICGCGCPVPEVDPTPSCQSEPTQIYNGEIMITISNLNRLRACVVPPFEDTIRYPCQLYWGDVCNTNRFECDLFEGTYILSPNTTNPNIQATTWSILEELLETENVRIAITYTNGLLDIRYAQAVGFNGTDGTVDSFDCGLFSYDKIIELNQGPGVIFSYGLDNFLFKASRLDDITPESGKSITLTMYKGAMVTPQIQNSINQHGSFLTQIIASNRLGSCNDNFALRTMGNLGSSLPVCDMSNHSITLTFL